MLETLCPQWWSSSVFAVFSAMWKQTMEVSSSWIFCIHFITHLLVDESSFLPWQRSSWRNMNVLLDSLKSMTLIMCRNGTWIFQKPLWKMEGWDYNMKLLWWSASYLPPADVRSLKLSERGRLITPCCEHTHHRWAKSRSILSITYLSVISRWIMQILNTSALTEAFMTFSVHVWIFYRLYF